MFALSGGKLVHGGATTQAQAKAKWLTTQPAPSRWPLAFLFNRKPVSQFKAFHRSV